MSTTNEYKIAIIGPQETVSGFKALGVEAFSAHNAHEVVEQLRHIKQQTTDTDSNNRYAVVCIVENVLTDLDQAEYAKVVAGPLPAVVILPGPEGGKGVALDRLRKLAEQAVGTAII